MLQWEHSAILLTFMKLPSVIKIFVLSIFEWLFKTGFTVQALKILMSFHKLAVIQSHHHHIYSGYRLVFSNDITFPFLKILFDSENTVDPH